MGKYTTVSSTSATACCSGGISGVTCSGSNVTRLDWFGQSLKNKIPSDIGKLTNLERLNLQFNQLYGTIPSEIGKLTKLTHLVLSINQLNGTIPSEFGKLTKLTHLVLSVNQLNGTIPSEIGNLTKLIFLYVDNNPNLGGALTPRCGRTVNAINTNITICGCASKNTPPSIFPPAGTPIECLATGPASPLMKRNQVFTAALQGWNLTCTVDENLNPFQDCLNTMGALCSSTYISVNSTRITNCKTSIGLMVDRMSPLCKAVPQACAPWNGGSPISAACIDANKKLIDDPKTYYTVDGAQERVTSNLTNSVTTGLWNNPKITR
jgi:hypothetical protein